MTLAQRVNSLREHLRYYHPRYKFILSLPKGSRVLDLGCGECIAMTKFRELRPDLVFSAVDILDVAGCVPPSVDFHQVDIQQKPLPFGNDSFDAVYCSHVFEHLYSTDLILQEIRRVLSDNGRIYVETPSLNSLRVPSFGLWRDQDVPFNFYDDPTHIKPFSKTGLLIILKRSGFTKITVAAARNPWSLLLSPYIFLRGLVTKDRPLLTLAVWEITGWCIYAVAYNSKTRTD